MMKSTTLSFGRRILAPLSALVLVAGIANESIAGNIVGYVANWNGNPTFVQYGKLTHINFSFAECTASGGLTCDTTYLGSVVTKAHAAGVKVLISIGGASNGGTMTTAMRNARLTLTTNIENFVHTWNLDGADIDWEAPANASDGTLFNTLVQTLYTDLHPEGKLITAALDTGDWFGMYILGSSFAYLDMINVMSYDSGGDYYFSSGITYWTGRGAPKAKLMAGVGFFGNGAGGEKAYKDIVAADKNAPYVDSSNGYKYNGIPSMVAKTQVAKSNAGGIMIWELSQDTASTGSTSLMNTIYNTMVSSNYAPIGKVVSFRAQANSNFVSAANAGAGALIANRTNAGPSEQFKVVDMGQHNVALLSQVNGKYVTAANATSALIASKSSVGTQETFTWQINANGTVSLLSLANNDYVCADLNKGVPPNLWANRTSAAGWESYVVTEVVTLGVRTAGTQVVLTLPTNPGHNSQIEYADNLSSPTWTPLGGSVMGTGAVISITNTPTSAQQFFRASIQ
ncbi:MAG TPA: glycosyl hydrolase family 18 protein [Verrucomicrobiae bacterium]|nr:glycosyl hydrolase family 18 protein [Verrucomicrobiae bacterium]